jgi:hypothetical protein
MKLNLNSMDKRLKTAGLVTLGAALLAYPAMRLYKYLAARRAAGNEDGVTHKPFASAYRGNHKPHHRKVLQNGKLA